MHTETHPVETRLLSADPLQFSGKLSFRITFQSETNREDAFGSVMGTISYPFPATLYP